MQLIVGVVEVILRFLDHRTGGIHILDGGVICGIVDVLRRGDPVIRSDRRIEMSLPVVPARAPAEVERPFCHVLVGFPAFGETGQDVAVGVIVDKRVNDVRTQRCIYGGVRHKVVQRLYLRGIERPKRHGILKRKRHVVSLHGRVGSALTGTAAEDHRNNREQGGGHGAPEWSSHHSDLPISKWLCQCCANII